MQLKDFSDIPHHRISLCSPVEYTASEIAGKRIIIEFNSTGCFHFHNRGDFSSAERKINLKSALNEGEKFVNKTFSADDDEKQLALENDTLKSLN